MSAEKQTAYLVTCPRCDTRNAYRTDQAGRDVRCEMCHTWFTAPKLVKPRKAPSKKAGQAAGYEVSGAAPGQKRPKLREFSLDCELCGTRMTFREDHVGRTARCPDCYTQLTVPKPPPLPSKDKTTTESYGVSQEEPPQAPPINQEGMGYAFIPRPGAIGPLFSDDEIDELTAEQAPTASSTPRDNPRTNRERRRNSPTARANPDSEFESWSAPLSSDAGSGPSGEPRWKNEVRSARPADAHPHTQKPARDKSRQADAPPEKRPRQKKQSRAEKNTERVAEQRANAQLYDDVRDNPVPQAAAYPMLNGIYTIPFRAQTFLRWFVLTLLLGLFAGFLGLTLYFVSEFPPSVFYMIPGVVFFGILAFGYISICVHAIVIDTANGADDIESWNDIDWRHWVFAFFQLAISGMLIFSLGMLLARMGGLPFGQQRFVAAGFVAIFLPVYYASAVSENANIIIISRFVAESFRTVPQAWLSLYVQSALLIIAFGAGFALLRAFSAAAALGVACPVLAAIAFVWARLIGRVLWLAGQARVAAASE